jgi:hypothetical protein
MMVTMITAPATVVIPTKMAETRRMRSSIDGANHEDDFITT